MCQGVEAEVFIGQCQRLYSLSSGDPFGWPNVQLCPFLHCRTQWQTKSSLFSASSTKFKIWVWWLVVSAFNLDIISLIQKCLNCNENYLFPIHPIYHDEASIKRKLLISILFDRIIGKAAVTSSQKIWNPCLCCNVSYSGYKNCYN